MGGVIKDIMVLDQEFHIPFGGFDLGDAQSQDDDGDDRISKYGEHFFLLALERI